MLGKIKISKADKYFSLYIRNKDKRCMRCLRQLAVEELQCSHYFGRRMASVRWDENNCDSLCFGCHRFWEKEDREAYREFKIKQLGEKGFNQLNIKARTITKRKLDEKMAEIVYKQKLIEIGVKV